MSSEYDERARKLRAEWEAAWATVRPMNWNTSDELDDLDARISKAISEEVEKARKATAGDCAEIALNTSFSRLYDCENCGSERITHHGCYEISKAIKQKYKLK